MAPNIRMEEERDFTGGLNLEPTPYNLARNETFDLLNVDLNRNGGFGLRRGIRRFIDVAPGLQGGEPDSGAVYVDASLARHTLVARSGEVRRWDGAAWQNVRSAFGGSGRTIFAEMNNTLYLGTVGTVPHKWTGSGVTTALTTVVGNYVDDLEAPNGGNFPQCNTFAVHSDTMWAGGVVDTGGVTFDNRLRWSHPANVSGGHPEDWHSKHFIDLDPDDECGRIRALVPFGDRLYVFKDKAIYAIHGYPPEGVTKNAITKKLGTPSQWSVVATEQAIYFWDIDSGAWKLDGKGGLTWIGRPIYQLIDDRTINVQFSFQVIAAYHRDRVWFSVPFVSGPIGEQFGSLIFAPNTGKNGAWTLHSGALFGWWVHRDSDGGDTHLIGGKDFYLQELDVEGFYQDQFHGIGMSLDAGGERASTPDAPAHDFSSDPEFEFSGYRADWFNTLNTAEIMAAKWAAVDGSRTFMFNLLDGGFLELRWTELGTIATQRIAVSTAPIPVVPGIGGFMAHKATIDLNNGAGGHAVTFWSRNSSAASWTQVGAPVSTGAFTTAIHNGAAELTVGSAAAGATIFAGYDTFRGHVNKFVMRDGIGGTEKANPSFVRNPITTSFADAAGLTWTLSAGASIFGLADIFQRLTAWYTTRWFDAGSAAYEKRWKRPVFVVNGESNQVTHVEVLSDYDSTKVSRTFQVNTSVAGEQLVWNESNWNEAVWAEGLGEKTVVLRGSQLGGGVAKALRFKPISTGAPWSMHGLTMKWIPRRVKN